ncbi:DNA polymerase III subunit gamma/tau [Campylobacter sp.]|uniref:DNA polymerase III subunit gamma/tau n=1 Tax=Campylobacter sp. TaxID=205 RepID=UPI002A605708|nr:DNA polymerase III subunit gamma/tau [Campylobacter sp.]MDD7703161.1 DNA polymerase III subunit gamma/tau [Campylobacteraceae bacterium]MDY2634731.1 DNA polymerase III subunit gamma/tau [Campylobacter sp.]
MQALALKYRPKSFYELIGQEAIKENLIHALDSGRLGHAYLFSGLRGSGKTSSARIFAKDLLCERGVGSHACESCASCISANEGRHMDIIEMDAASHRKIEDIRDLIEQTRYAPVSGRFKIFIIDEAHMLTKEASNAFLKTLEEPPAYIKFILATTDPLKLPATILSRTQHFRFKAISHELIVKHLEDILIKEQISFESDALKIIARSGSGSLRDTLTLLDQAIIFCGGAISTHGVTDMLGLLDPRRIDEILSTAQKGSHEELCALIKSLEDSDAEMIINELIASLKERFLEPRHEFSLLIFERFFKILSEAKNMLGSGADPAFVLYIALFSMRNAFDIGAANFCVPQPSLAQSRIPSQPALVSPSPAPQPSSTPQQSPVQSRIPSNTQPISAARIPSQQPIQSALVSPNPASAQSSAIAQPQSSQDAQKYEHFVKLLYDRSYDLGKIFDNFIEFGGFDGENITLISSAIADDAAVLRTHSGVLRELAQIAFGAKKFKVEKKQNGLSDIINSITKLEQTPKQPEQYQPEQYQNEPAQEDFSSDESLAPPMDMMPNIAPAIKSEPTQAEINRKNENEMNRLFGNPEIKDNNE